MIIEIQPELEKLTPLFKEAILRAYQKRKEYPLLDMPEDYDLSVNDHVYKIQLVISSANYAHVFTNSNGNPQAEYSALGLSSLFSSDDDTDHFNRAYLLMEDYLSLMDQNVSSEFVVNELIKYKKKDFALNQRARYRIELAGISFDNYYEKLMNRFSKWHSSYDQLTKKALRIDSLDQIRDLFSEELDHMILRYSSNRALGHLGHDAHFIPEPKRNSPWLYDLDEQIKFNIKWFTFAEIRGKSVSYYLDGDSWEDSLSISIEEFDEHYKDNIIDMYLILLAHRDYFNKELDLDIRNGTVYRSLWTLRHPSSMRFKHYQGIDLDQRYQPVDQYNVDLKQQLAAGVKTAENIMCELFSRKLHFKIPQGITTPQMYLNYLAHLY